MIELRTLLLAAGLGLVSDGFAQEPKAQEPAAPQTKEAARSVEQWIGDLGAESFKTRVNAEKALREMGDKALPELKKAAESADDQEVQWRARRLVRQIEKAPEQGLQRRAPGTAPTPLLPHLRTPNQGGAPDDFQQQFERLFDAMERDFGVDIPRARFFDDNFFRDLQNQLPRNGTSQGLSMQVGPDGGVRVEVKTKNDKGEVESKTYEAESMEEFERQYPGVLQQHGVGGGFGLRFFQDPGSPLVQGWTMPPMDRQRWFAMPGSPDPVQVDPAVEPPPAGSRLGVTIRQSIPEELREHLELDANTGLMVETVQPDTLAEAIGLQRGDIVTKIAGHAIGSASDVQKVLSAIDAGTSVEVTFLRKGAEKTASAKKAAAGAPPAEKPKAERLEKRKSKAQDSGIR